MYNLQHVQFNSDLFLAFFYNKCKNRSRLIDEIMKNIEIQKMVLFTLCIVSIGCTLTKQFLRLFFAKILPLL